MSQNICLRRHREFIQKSVSSGYWVRAVLLLRLQLCTQPWRPDPNEGAESPDFPSASELNKRFHEEKARGGTPSAMPSPGLTSSSSTSNTAKPAAGGVRSSLSSLSRAKTAAKPSTTPPPKAAERTSTSTSTSNSSHVAGVMTTLLPARKPTFPTGTYAQPDPAGGLESAMAIGFGLGSIECPTYERKRLLATGCDALLSIFFERSPKAAMFLLEAAKKFNVLPMLRMSTVHDTLSQHVLPALGGREVVDAEGKAVGGAVDAVTRKQMEGLMFPLFSALMQSSRPDVVTAAAEADKGHISPIDLLVSPQLVNSGCATPSASEGAVAPTKPKHTTNVSDNAEVVVKSIANPNQFDIFAQMATRLLSAANDCIVSTPMGVAMSLSADEATTTFLVGLGSELFEAIVADTNPIGSGSKGVIGGKKGSDVTTSDAALLEQRLVELFVGNDAFFTKAVGDGSLAVLLQAVWGGGGGGTSAATTAITAAIRGDAFRSAVVAKVFGMLEKCGATTTASSIVGALVPCVEHCDVKVFPEGEEVALPNLRAAYEHIVAHCHLTTEAAVDDTADIANPAAAADAIPIHALRMAAVRRCAREGNLSDAIAIATVGAAVPDITSPATVELRRALWYNSAIAGNAEVVAAFQNAVTEPLDDTNPEEEAETNASNAGDDEPTTPLRPVRALSLDDLALRVVFGPYATERLVHGPRTIRAVLETFGATSSAVASAFGNYNGLTIDELVKRFDEAVEGGVSSCGDMGAVVDIAPIAEWVLSVLGSCDNISNPIAAAKAALDTQCKWASFSIPTIGGDEVSGEDTVSAAKFAIAALRVLVVSKRLGHTDTASSDLRLLTAMLDTMAAIGATLATATKVSNPTMSAAPQQQLIPSSSGQYDAEAIYASIAAEARDLLPFIADGDCSEDALHELTAAATRAVSHCPSGALAAAVMILPIAEGILGGNSGENGSKKVSLEGAINALRKSIGLGAVGANTSTATSNAVNGNAKVPNMFWASHRKDGGAV